MASVKANIIGASFVMFCFVCLLILATVTLIAERNADVVRITVPASELLPTVRAVQGITGKTANAYPLNGDEDTATHWRVVIDPDNELNN
jgi:hypothetical protein